LRYNGHSNSNGESADMQVASNNGYGHSESADYADYAD